MSAPLTPVIFRRLKSDVIALFPYECGDMNPYTCASFMHVGQHSTAGVDIIRDTKPASLADSDVQALRNELESAPYNYRLRILKRMPANALAMRRAELTRTRS